MVVIILDDEKFLRETMISEVEVALPEADIVSFGLSRDCVAWAQSNYFDIAFLDIQMPGMTGVEVAEKLKKINPNVNIIFTTGYSEYKPDAMDMHASGYIMKPVTAEKIIKELNDLRHPVEDRTNQKLIVTCFGNFDVTIGSISGMPLRFSRSKSKELFAYLIYRRGASCTNHEILATIFEEDTYADEESQLSYLRHIVSSLVKNFSDVGYPSIIQKGYNSISLNTEDISCDYLDYCNGQKELLKSYNGEFMSQYSWAEDIAGLLSDDKYELGY